MKKIFLFFIPFFLFARINPFSPIENPATLTNNNVPKQLKFKDLDLTLPSSARVVKEIKIIYQNIDGTVGEISENINKEVDWHNPIEIRHKMEDEKIDYDKNVFRDLNLENIDFLKLSVLKPNLKILTKDKLINHFSMSDPTRIVIDFERESDFTTIEKDINNNLFTKVIIGNHGNFYRVVVYLDSYYKYQIVKIDDGFVLGIK